MNGLNVEEDPAKMIKKIKKLLNLDIVDEYPACPHGVIPLTKEARENMICRHELSNHEKTNI